MLQRRYFYFALPLAVLAGLGIAGLVLRSGAAENGEAAAVPQPATSRIVHVTVYPNSALIVREVDVPAGVGPCELVVNPLPSQTVDSSLYSEGSDGIRVLSTRYRTRPIREDNREEVRKLTDELRKLQQNGQRIQADITSLQQNIQMLAKMESFSSAPAPTSGEKAALNSESVIALAKYVMESRAAKAKELVGLQHDLQTNKEQMEFTQRQLQDLTAGTSRVERDAVIVVDKANGAPGKVRLNYLVNAASWRPQYKFRAGKDGTAPVQLEYLAGVIQQSGEDWNGVQVTLSTAQPTLNAAPPDLCALDVTVVPRGQPNPMPPGISNPSQMEFANRGKQLRQQGQEQYLRRDVDNGAKFLNDAAAVEATWALLYSSREELNRVMRNRGGNGDEGPTVTYQVPTRLSVPSRHDEHVIEVAKIDLKPEYFYKAVPALTNHIYRQANLTNESKYVLLPGEATMYQGTDFVGRMNVPLVAIGEQFTVGFGVDPQLQVQRQMMDKTRTTQGGNQVLKFDYRILISSYKTEPVQVQLWDRLPHAEVEAVGISLLRASPDMSKDSLYLRESRPNNLLRWDLEIKPSMNGEKAYPVSYEFQMALDKNMTVGGFQTK